jgi:SAM-dependent methyltransferase
MSETPKAQAWNDYWAGQQGGCLPESSSTLDAAFRAEWHRVALALGDKARVIDLATGNGVVLRWLHQARPDLDLTGVDLAAPLPPPPPGCVTRGGVAMEHLPWPSASFDAVVSQFGFEYGALDETAAEVARVLSRGGTMSLITHHADGPIVAHNRARAAGLSWTLDELAMVARARDAAGDDESRRAIAQAPKQAVARFGAGSAAWQLAEAIARVVRDGGTPLDARAMAMLDRLERMARGEISRIRALEQASAAIADDGRLVKCLGVHDLILRDRHPVIHAPDRLTIAYCWTFERR